MQTLVKYWAESDCLLSQNKISESIISRAQSNPPGTRIRSYCTFSTIVESGQYLRPNWLTTGSKVFHTREIFTSGIRAKISLGPAKSSCVTPGKTNIPILYGGSVKASNSAKIFSLKNVDGGLIGGASLIASEFCKIYDTL